MRSLRPFSSPGVWGHAQQEHAEQRKSLAVQAERLLGEVAVLDRAAGVTAGQPGHPVTAQPLGRVPAPWSPRSA